MPNAYVDGEFREFTEEEYENLFGPKPISPLDPQAEIQKAYQEADIEVQAKYEDTILKGAEHLARGGTKMLQLNFAKALAVYDDTNEKEKAFFDRILPLLSLLGLEKDEK